MTAVGVIAVGVIAVGVIAVGVIAVGVTLDINKLIFIAIKTLHLSSLSDVPF